MSSLTPKASYQSTMGWYCAEPHRRKSRRRSLRRPLLPARRNASDNLGNKFQRRHRMMGPGRPLTAGSCARLEQSRFCERMDN